MSGSRRFFSASSESQAVSEAAAHFGVAPEELAYRAREGGGLRLGRVVIEVDPRAPRRAAAPSAAAASEERRRAASGVAAAASPSPPDDDGAPGDEGEEELPLRGADGVRRAAAAVVALGALGVEAVVSEQDGVRLELDGAGRDALLARGGELLRASEYLLRRMVRELPGEGLLVDSGGYRAEREAALRRRAREAAAAVRQGGAPVLLEPLPAAERRIVHLAIQEESGVASASEGSGEAKRVRIFPAP